MQAIREIIDRGQLANVPIPAEFGNRLEIIILPAAAAEIPAESLAVMQAFEQTGFAREVLADPAEDIWNDLLADKNLDQDPDQKL